MADQRKEIGVLIKQAVAEIDRLTQRNRETPSQVRQLEANIESFPPHRDQTDLFNASGKPDAAVHDANPTRALEKPPGKPQRTEQLLDGFLQMTESLLQLDQRQL